MLHMKSLIKSYLPESIIFLILSVFFVGELVNGRFWLNDFRVYYTAAEQFIQGGTIYGEAFGLDSGFYKYSPFVLVFFVPFALLPFKIAAIIYYFITVFVIISLFINLKKCFLQYFPSLSNKRNLAVTLIVFLTLANHFFRELHLGNVNALVLLMTVYAMRLLLQENKSILSGIFIALCILIKPHFLILVPLFILRREYKFLLTLFVSLFVFSSFPALFVGIKYNNTLIAEWLQTIISHNSTNAYFANTTYCWIQKNMAGIGISIPQEAVFVFITTVVALLFFFLWMKHDKEEKQNQSISKQNFLTEYFLLISCIPNLVKTDTEHFLLSMPIILFLIMTLFSRKLSVYAIAVVTLGCVAFGGNWYDLVGRQISSLWNDWGIVGFGNLILMIITVCFYKKTKSSSRT